MFCILTQQLFQEEQEETEHLLLAISHPLIIPHFKYVK